jgi:hypothetical protein
MSQRYPGNIVRATPLTPTGPLQTGAASGVWTLDQAQYWLRQGLWPIAGNVPDGTFSIFQLGLNPSYSGTRNKYTYAGDVVTTATNSGNSAQGSATGTSAFGIFAIGDGGGFRSCGRIRYTYATCVVTGATAATAPSFFGSAAGNSTVGIFALGCIAGSGSSTTRNKYTYSGCVVSAGGAATSASYMGSATGNSTVGLFALGCVCGKASSSYNRYTYAGDVVASASGGCRSRRGSAVGNSTVGIFAIGCNYFFCACCPCSPYGGYTCGRRKYTYASSSFSSASSASAVSQFGSASGNGVVGIFALGANACNVGTTTRNKYTYASDTNNTGGAATNASQRGAGASNGIVGITL